MKLIDQMSKAVDGIWAEYYTHPFVKGIEDGTLDRERFRYYIIQDYLYLIEYTKVFGIVDEANKSDYGFITLIKRNISSGHSSGSRSSASGISWSGVKYSHQNWSI